MKTNYLKDLTLTQKKIVTAPFGPIRVIAGPGSGKTRVLTHRLVHLVVKGSNPNKIVALTFTNLAANEMKKRVQQLLGIDQVIPWISTYHSFCYQFLKKWGEIEHVTNELKFNRNFDILDRNAQKVVLKKIYKELNITYSDISYSLILSFIASKKKSGPSNFQLKHGERAIYENIFNEYINHQQHMNLLDFDDLIVITRKILDENEDVRKRWQKRIDYLLVDEFQDTSHDQAIIINHLVNPLTNNIFVVGDPFQTIYTWRGAKSEFLTIDFCHTFPKTKTYALVENFRSGQKIVAAANIIREQITTKFDEEKHKDLLSIRRNKGEIKFYHLDDYHEQAKTVVNKIHELALAGEKLKEMAILYRTNRESASYEKLLLMKGITYKVIGAYTFFNRKEIQDAIAYLSLINRTANDLHIERIMSAPKKGIGSTTINKLYEVASKTETSLSTLIFHSNSQYLFSKKARSKLQILKEALLKIRNKIKQNSQEINKAFWTFLKDISYFGMFEGKLEQDERRENIEELLQDMKEAFKDDTTTLSTYLDKLKLLDGTETIASDEYVSLMTFHKAKGKEYRHVFIVSLMEGHFPLHKNTLFRENTIKIKEEWRLFYVAITRAKDYLYLSCHDYEHTYTTKSRFLQVLDIFFNKEESEKVEYVKKKNPKQLAKNNFAINSIIYHKKFGKGIIIDDLEDRVLVNYAKIGKCITKKKSKNWSWTGK